MTTASTKKPTRRNPKKGTHLTEPEKAEAIALWQRGEVTLSDLEKRFGRHRSTFLALFAAAKVKKGEKAVETRATVEKAVQEATIADATLLAQRITDTKEEVFRFSSGIRKLIWLAVTKAKQENRPLESELGTIRTLKEAIQAIKVTQELSYEVLGMNEKEKPGENDTLPELVFHELTTDEVRLMVANQIESDDLGFQVDEIANEVDEAGSDATIEGDGGIDELVIE